MSDLPLLVIVLFGMGYLGARCDTPPIRGESVEPFAFMLWMVLGTSLVLAVKLAVSGTLQAFLR